MKTINLITGAHPNFMKVTPMLEFLQPLSAQAEPLERMPALEQRFFLTDHNLIYTDKMSMAVGVEVRVPFLDIDLVNFAARVPVKYKQHGPVGKWVLKKAMEPYLPHDVIYHPKSSFGAPLRRSLRAASSVDASYTLLSLLCIEIWCRTFIDGIPSKSPPTPLCQRGEQEVPFRKGGRRGGISVVGDFPSNVKRSDTISRSRYIPD